MQLGAEQVTARRHDLGHQTGAINCSFEEFMKEVHWVLCVLIVKNNFWLPFVPSQSPCVIF